MSATTTTTTPWKSIGAGGRSKSNALSSSSSPSSRATRRCHGATTTTRGGSASSSSASSRNHRRFSPRNATSSSSSSSVCFASSRGRRRLNDERNNNDDDDDDAERFRRGWLYSRSSSLSSKKTRLNAVLEPEQSNSSSSSSSEGGGSEASNNNNTAAAAAPKVKRLTKSEREKNSKDYEWAALISSCGVTSIAITATYFRLLRSYNLMDDGGASVFPTAELFAQLALIAGAAVGMEFYARFAHKYLWHDVWWSMPMKYRKDWNRKIWLLHESHHLPREGAFEANDIFAVANGVPAFVLCAYGFFTPGVYGGLCFGAGLGITLFGIAYMYVHDGMVHKRFPTGPLGKLPWLRRVAAAHTIHHTEQFKGAPWGLFLGEDELRKHPGGIEELDKVCLANDRADKRREMECLAAGFSKAEECDVPMELSVGSSKDEYLVVSQDETELGIKAGLHIPSQVEPPQCVITEDGKRINESANAEARE